MLKKITMSALLSTALVMAPMSVSAETSKVFGNSGAKILSPDANKKVVGKGYYADLYGYYGYVYAYYAYYYGYYGYAYSNANYYYTAYVYSYYATQYLYNAYYYQYYNM